MTYKELTKRLKKLGCYEIMRRKKGSHRKWINGKNGKGTIIPDWGGKDLKLGTIKGILKQLDISWDDFKNA